ncbi:MAG TPA: CRISPR-associated helicase Cas3' [Kofleriaceae bacterium]|jgi:CRISPR-associated endonuclease/helicase Cas3
MSSYASFFSAATGTEPFPYQVQFATEPALPDLLAAPTGAGKTATAVLGWLWRRRHHPDATVRTATPRRLIFCLPMRTLVEQTQRVTEGWLERVQLRNEVRLHAMLGGAVDDSWQEHPEAETIIVGTQDQLLSRALNRGYAMSRYKWPVHFALLNNDALWILDEVQLMGVGSSTTAQLQGLRDTIGTAAPTASIWMSATLAPGRLRTVDHRGEFRQLALGPADLDQPVLAARHHAPKQLQPTSTGNPVELARHVIAAHAPGSLTLVVFNQVRRAQEAYGELAKHAGETPVRLVHSRFRPVDRRAIQDEVLTPGWSGILVATQAIEAGVDISARTLFTEIASWSSLVQRFGRCNRRGEYTRDEAGVHWIDIDDSVAAPYEAAQLAIARARLTALQDVSPASLASVPVDDESPVMPVIRRRDLLDLFDTQPDLAGLDLDVSRWVRDADERDVQIAWRDLADEAPARDAPEPQRDELCSVPISELRKLLERTRVFRWSGLLDAWEPISAAQLVPGMAVIASRAIGGYERALGWTARATHLPAAIVAAGAEPDSDEREELSFTCDDFVPLAVHSDDVAQEAEKLRALITGDVPWEAVVRASRWHDLGKAHRVFQEMITSGLDANDPRRSHGPWAKSDGRRSARFTRRAFRHELASALALLQQGGTDLEAFLVAAHHGKVRLSVRPRPNEVVPDDGRRFALGVWDTDELAATDLGNGIASSAVKLDLSITALGDGPSGPSWLDRMARLVRTHGPFRLALWETIVRVADWRGTARRRRGGDSS